MRKKRLKNKPREFQSFSDVELPAVLYKYREWKKPVHQTILTERQVYFARPSSFADPLDCKNPTRYDLLNDAEFWECLKYQLKKQHPEWNVFQIEASARLWLTKSPSRDPGYIEKMEAQFFHEYDERIGILSLTANPISQEMWEQYADHCRGFAVGFYPHIMFDYLGGGAPVTYCDELPIIYPQPLQDFMTQHYNQVYHKLKKWEFEQEYRTQKSSRSSLSEQERTVVLPSEAYAHILIGKDMPPEDEQLLRTSLPNELHDVPIVNVKAVFS